jgi:hypothetical protein
MITVGFTGTRSGMSSAQRQSVLLALRSLLEKHGEVRAVHGDCVGADADFDQLCSELQIPREIYPCTIENARAHCENKGALCLRQPIAPLKRNEQIVNAVDILFATPYSRVEERRSGTWFTVRYARKISKPHEIFFTDTNP